MWKTISFIGLLLLGYVLATCSDQGWDDPSDERVHPPTAANTQYLGTKDFHGTIAKDQGIEVCKSCHGTDLEGKSGVLGCNRCHFGPDGSWIPEGADWEHGLNYHWEFEADQEVCTACHDVQRRSGTGPRDCHECHGDGTVHVLGQAWLDKKSSEFHGMEPAEDCSRCHEVSEKCSECHFGDTGSKSPPGSGWVHDGDEDNEDHRRYESYMTTCNQCHKVNRSYFNDPESCHNCHEEEDD